MSMLLLLLNRDFFKWQMLLLASSSAIREWEICWNDQLLLILASRQRMEEEVDFLNGIIWWKVTQQQKSTFLVSKCWKEKLDSRFFGKILDLDFGFWTS